jgi:hypothetical protein
VLIPGDSRTKNFAYLTVCAPVLKEVLNLAFSLDPLLANEAAASIVLGTVEEGPAGVAVVASFGEDAWHRFLFGVI